MSILSGENKPHRKYLEAICAIPRPSCKEKQVSEYIISVAEKLGLDYETDELFNVIVRKPASPGLENSPALMLQAHTDMVCVKAPDKDFCFDTDPLDIYVEDEILRARGTTLGADDGYGVAYLLAAMEEEFVHPPLELVFTSQEENGCYGAQALNCSHLKSRRMIGLDVMGQETEYTCTVSCFCSDRLRVIKDCDLISAKGDVISLKVSGIQPVHEGVNVHPEIHNAIKILARLLKVAAERGISLNLVSAEGGEAENYNPVTASVVIATGNAEELKKAMSGELAGIIGELDDGMQSIRLDAMQFSYRVNDNETEA